MGLCTRPVKYIHFEEISSTHIYAMANGAFLSDFTVITADHQSDGRGRLGRKWISSAGDSLLASVLLKPSITLQEASLLTPVLSVAICEYLDEFDLACSIRWPNDVMVGERKIAGILSEASYSDKLEFVVASFGLNVRQKEGALALIDRPATSIYSEKGRLLDPKSLCSPMISHFASLYFDFLKSGADSFFNRWEKRMSMIGREVSIDTGKERIDGKVLKFYKNGSIEVRDLGGVSHRFHAGEILRVGPRGRV
ncbi:MAG TPA: biotin--[acetyl-CoA-carboxylase] ligase [bacterium]|nr:biotin--[acetyl-CoA-carboxylase] ligase [Myxococcales bacterium]HQC50234.1 biotin--[acetyl-CoA-carboxylase] ligase [bacterium]